MSKKIRDTTLTRYLSLSKGADTLPLRKVEEEEHASTTIVLAKMKGNMGAETEVPIVVLTRVSIAHDTRKVADKGTATGLIPPTEKIGGKNGDPKRNQPTTRNGDG